MNAKELAAILLALEEILTAAGDLVDRRHLDALRKLQAILQLAAMVGGRK